MKIEFEARGSHTLARVVPESDDERKFLRLMVDRQFVVPEICIEDGITIEEMLIHFYQKK